MGVVQPKLSVTEPGDRYEREADRVARQVMRTADPTVAVAPRETEPKVQRMCSRCQRRARQGKPLNCPECEEELQRKAESGTGGSPAMDGETQRQVQALRGGGQPLPDSVRSFFEPRFGRDFGDVRVHTGRRADETARAVNARAFTVGRDVVFKRGEYEPGTRRGKRLIAHELVHVRQQTGARETGTVQRQPDEPGTKAPPKRQEDCVNKRPVTEAFRSFARDLPTLLSKANLSSERESRLVQHGRRILTAGTDLTSGGWTVYRCEKIRSWLASGRGKTASALVDSSAKELWLSASTVEDMNTFLQSQDIGAFTSFLQSVAHEKRHVGLEDVPALSVSPGQLEGDTASPRKTAGKARYHVEEILATAEEIAVGTQFSKAGEPYGVSAQTQQKFQRQWNLLGGLVSKSEQKRLRGEIRAQLDERYGSESGCDDVITVGVMKAMESGQWYRCGDDGTVSDPPANLNPCQDVCPTG